MNKTSINRGRQHSSEDSSKDSSKRTTCDQSASQLPVISLFSLKRSVSVFCDGRKRKTEKNSVGCFVWVFQYFPCFISVLRCFVSVFSMFHHFNVLVFRCFSVSLFWCFRVSMFCFSVSFQCLVAVIHFGVSWFSNLQKIFFKTVFRIYSQLCIFCDIRFHPFRLKKK